MAADAAVKSGKRGVATALILVLVMLALLGAAYVFLGGADLVAGPFGGTPSETAATPVTPGAPSATVTTTETPVVQATAQPTDEQAAAIYWEQVASQEQISKLVSGEITNVSFGSVSKTDDAANVRL